MPSFSIVIPAYNAEHTLQETLCAVQRLEWQDWECIVVDDGSTDGTARVAELFSVEDSRFHVLHQHNQGTAAAYNTGVIHSSAPLIVICSADDILLPHHLTVMHEFSMQWPDVGVFSSGGYYLYESGETLSVYMDPAWESERSVTFNELLSSCFYSVGAVFRRTVFDSVDGFRPGAYGEDYDFWLRAMAAGVTHRHRPEILSQHRVSDGQKSADVERVYLSNIDAYHNLLESELVGTEYVSVVLQAILDREELLSRVRNRSRMDAMRATGRSLLRAVFGPRVASTAIRFIKSWSRGRSRGTG